jgi:hypothetical protein
MILVLVNNLVGVALIISPPKVLDNSTGIIDGQ